jgi:hypothetical protein
MLARYYPRAIWPAIGAALVAMACNEPRQQVLSKEQSDQVLQALLSAPPAPTTPIGAVFDQKVKLLGVDLPKAPVKVGETFDVTWYWEVLDTPPPGEWKIFVHVEVPPAKRTTHDHHAVRELYPMAKWQKGQIIKDEQKIAVGKDFPNGAARLHVGVFDEKAWKERKANVRMAVTNADQVKGFPLTEGRLQVGSVMLEGGGAAAKLDKPPAPAPGPKVLTARKLTAAPEIDGKSDEPVWREARPTGPLTRPDGSRLDAAYNTQARLGWDDANLYVSFSARDDDITNGLTGARDKELWKEDVVEVYLDPGADGKDYIEIQVSPAGEIFDAVFESHRSPAWADASKKLDITDLRAKVELQGSLNARDDGVIDQAWNVEIVIPFTGLPGFTGPPKEGEEWGLNLYRLDVAGPSRGGFAAAWALPKSAGEGFDFHSTETFGKLKFAGAGPVRPIIGPIAPITPGGSAPPPPPAPPAPPTTSPAPPARPAPPSAGGPTPAPAPARPPK